MQNLALFSSEIKVLNVYIQLALMRARARVCVYLVRHGLNFRTQHMFAKAIYIQHNMCAEKVLLNICAWRDIIIHLWLMQPRSSLLLSGIHCDPSPPPGMILGPSSKGDPGPLLQGWSCLHPIPQRPSSHVAPAIIPLHVYACVRSFFWCIILSFL